MEEGLGVSILNPVIVLDPDQRGQSTWPLWRQSRVSYPTGGSHPVAMDSWMCGMLPVPPSPWWNEDLPGAAGAAQWWPSSLPGGVGWSGYSDGLSCP